MNVIVAGVLPPFTLNIWQDISAMLQYDFMRQALLAGTILSMVAGLVGYFVVLRHQAFAGESLSDVAFTGALGGAALGFNPLASLLGTTIVVAIAMGGFGERLRGRDVAVGTVLAWVLGLGVLFLSLFTTQVSGTGTGFSGVTVLFGNILGISTGQTYSIALISALAADKINLKVESAQATIREALVSARAEIEAVAAEATSQMVSRLTGISVDPKDAAAAVKAELNA